MAQKESVGWEEVWEACEEGVVKDQNLSMRMV